MIIDYRAILFKTLDIFFFKLKHTIGHISGMVGLIDMKQNEVHQLDIG